MLFDEPDNPRWKLLSAAEDRLANAPDTDAVIEVVRSAARGIFSADGVTFVLREGELCHYLDENAIGPLWKGRRLWRRRESNPMGDPPKSSRSTGFPVPISSISRSPSS